MKVILFVFLSVSLFSNPNEKIFQEVFDLDKKLHRSNFENGKHPGKLLLGDLQQYESLLKEYLRVHKKLKKVPLKVLKKDDFISHELMIHKLNNTINDLSHKSYLIPFSSEGGFFNSVIFSLNDLPYNTLEDLKAYKNWLEQYPDYINSYKVFMQEGIKEGIVAPKIIANNIIELMMPFISMNKKINPFLEPISDLQIENSEDILKEINEVILFKIVPSYQQLIGFINTEYLPACTDKPGISNIQNGKDFYEKKVRYYSTLNISPDSVFNLGMKEVNRIKSQMMDIINDLEFDGGFEAFLKYLRTNNRFYPKSEQELLNYAAWLSKKAEGQLPKYFSKLYELPFTVQKVPLNIAPNYTAGRFVHGSRQMDKPGIYWVNTYDLNSRTLYTLPALTLHEAVPGHHLQIQRAAELDHLSEFRRNYYISAFGEGWGLYAEYLGEEMGMYEDPFDLFGRYTYEMWRACRLVVDVGIHYKGWTREQAVKFMSENTALSMREVNTEIDRYIGWPAQAISYKIGEICIKELREKAQEELGNKFNIKEFHEIILGNGSVTLPILINNVKEWISNKK